MLMSNTDVWVTPVASRAEAWIETMRGTAAR